MIIKCICNCKIHIEKSTKSGDICPCANVDSPPLEC